MAQPALYPWIIGDKVTLRPFSAEDITDTYLDWLNDPQLMRLSNQRFLIHDRSSSLIYLRSFAGSTNFFLGVIDNRNSRLIGTMTAYLSPHHGTADMGILIGDATVRGRGYGMDAWQNLMNWLLNTGKLRKVTAGTLSCNTQMLKLINGSGMVADGVRRQQEMIDGVAQDMLYFARFGHA